VKVRNIFLIWVEVCIWKLVYHEGNIYMIKGVEEDRLLDVEKGNINEIIVEEGKIDKYGIN